MEKKRRGEARIEGWVDDKKGWERREGRKEVARRSRESGV